MINITFPDNSVRQYDNGISPLDVAKNISHSLAKKVICARINGTIIDASFPLNEDCSIELVTNDNETDEILDIVRHDAAHLLAQAVLQLYDDVEITIGPTIANGFYYDFASKHTFSTDDFAKIESKMHELSRKSIHIKRIVMAKSDAVDFFTKKGFHYKVEILNDIPDSEKISIYEQGDFTDLCRGPHAPNTSFVKHFKLLKVSSSYWRGDANNVSLQRIYGTAWLKKESLENYLIQLSEAENRDHRKIGKELDLFHQQEDAIGDIFWHPNGKTIYNIIEQYMRNVMQNNGYQEVKTPQLLRKTLWEKSGHWEKFHENMFISNVDDEEYAIKPMNCPGHVQIFNHKIRSYKDLPIRLAEFGCCHRYEPSGSLHGIMRVRAFTQDDAHIFCKEDQITKEVISFCELLKKVYSDFGFTDIKVKFSDRPIKRIGTDITWDKAENSLKEAITVAGYDYILSSGEGAFYGPKLEFVLRDAIGRDWQCGTLQVDFMLPERFSAHYIDEHGLRARPIMLHRAILGSLERFIGILIEHHAGKFPLWIAPIQVVVCGVTNRHDNYVIIIRDKLLSIGIRVLMDITNDTVNHKIRKHSNQKVPIILIIGDKEVAQNSVSIRRMGSTAVESLDMEAFISQILLEMRSPDCN